MMNSAQTPAEDSVVELTDVSAAAEAATRASIWVAGSDRPEQRTVRVGFMPLTDCASVVMASLLGFDKKYGIEIVVSREASWAAVRDKLCNGELDAAQVLYGLLYGVHMGISGQQKDMAVLMTLNHNGQAITVSSSLAAKGGGDGAGLAKCMAQEPRRYTFAQTFPGGTHAMWLHYWMAAHGINPQTDAKVITVPPPQMVANLRLGQIDGYCAGAPWNQRAVADGIGVTAATSAQIWPDHPEKVLGTSAEFADRCPHTARALTAAILDASRWLDAAPLNRSRMAKILAGSDYLNTSVDVIDAALLGPNSSAADSAYHARNEMKFFNDGAVNFPYLSDGMWFLTQHKRWGLLKSDPVYLDVASTVNRIDLYREAASLAKVALPASSMRSSRLIDGIVWDGSNPAAYAASFPIGG